MQQENHAVKRNQYVLKNFTKTGWAPDQDKWHFTLCGNRTCDNIRVSPGPRGNATVAVG